MSDTAPQVPSAWQLERAVSAWQQLQALYAANPTLAEDEEVISAALADAEITHPEVLLERAIDAIVWCERREIEADELRRDMIARRDRYRARAVAIRDIIEQLLTALEKKAHRAKLARAGMVMGRPSVVITDEGLVPDTYFRVERTLLKTPLHDDLEQGVVVPGAVLSNAVPYLQIRKL